MTGNEIDATCIPLRARPLRGGRAFIALADFGNAVRRARKSVKENSLTGTRDELGPGCRYVHAEGDIEREPIGDEPYTIVHRKGDSEYVTTPVFKSPHGLFRLVKPYLAGPWDICEGCDVYYPLPDGREQGFWVWIRMAREVRK